MSRVARFLMPWLVGGVVFFWVFAVADTLVGLPDTVRQVVFGVVMAPWALLFVALIPFAVVNGIAWFRNALPAEISGAVRTTVGVVLTLIVVAMILSGIFDPVVNRIASLFDVFRTSVFGSKIG